jgi:ABC-2 type transport system permease protein
MDFSSLLGKELTWGRHKLLALAALFVALPAVFAYATVGFESVLPTAVPVAVAPQTAAVSSADLSIARGATAVLSDPRIFETQAAAMDALGREQVYAVVAVPPGLADASRGVAEFTVYVEGSVVPYHQPANGLTSVLQVGLSETLPRDVSVTREVVGAQHSLSAYLVPGFVLALVGIVALAYVPHTLDREAAVLDRLRVETSLHAVVASKLAFFGGLLVVPLAVFDATSAYLGGSMHVLGVGTLLVVALTFLLLGLLGAAVQFVVGFGAWGRITNLLVLLAFLAFSGLAYPVGFFSPARRWLVRQLPTHYAAVATRGFVLRGDPVGLYADWLAGLAGAVVVAALAFAGAVEYYERRA